MKYLELSMTNMILIKIMLNMLHESRHTLHINNELIPDHCLENVPCIFRVNFLVSFHIDKHVPFY